MRRLFASQLLRREIPKQTRTDVVAPGVGIFMASILRSEKCALVGGLVGEVMEVNTPFFHATGTPRPGLESNYKPVALCINSSLVGRLDSPPGDWSWPLWDAVASIVS